MDRSILITGCSSGIGYDAAHGLKARGWRVFATCRNEVDCENLRKEGLESFRLDYDDTTSIQSAVKYILNKNNGVLGALFNNGAFACPGALEDLPRDALRAIFETNLFGYHELTREIIPIMRAQGYGRIINCSSVLGIVPLKWRGAYNATKFALEGLTQTLRLEMQDTPVKVILINLSDKVFVVEKGLRIAQMVLCPVIEAKLSEVEIIDETERGEGGFGSTGTK